jgi:hypothetical protein
MRYFWFVKNTARSISLFLILTRKQILPSPVMKSLAEKQIPQFGKQRKPKSDAVHDAECLTSP